MDDGRLLGAISMKMLKTFAPFLVAAGMMAVPTTAYAQSDSYRIDANSSRNTTITICNPEVRVDLRGDGDTDLDFVITNSSGTTVWSDYSTSDRASTTLRRRSSSGCEDFTLRTSNLGNVWNMLDISLEDIRINSGNPVDTDSYRVSANDNTSITMNVCSPRVRLNVRGDGDTDLDFVVRNSSGTIVHSDYDTTDRTEAVLNRRSGVNCEDFTLRVNNLGSVYNLFTVQLEDLRSSGATQTRNSAGSRGSNDSYNRNVTIRNRTGQTITYLYWSNTAASNWGSDQLGSGVLGAGQDWRVEVDDGSGACTFDFKARLSSGREIERRDIDVCAVFNIDFN